MTEAFYLPTGEPGGYLATVSTGGPWDAELQHGGPPAALLARAAESEPAEHPSTVVRMAVEILGPVPVGEVTVASRLARSGRSVEMVEAELSAGGRTAVRARAWRVRRTELELPRSAQAGGSAPPMPADDDELPADWGGPFLRCLQTRFVVGSWMEVGPATVWVRQRIPLVAGEEPSGLQRLMVLADCGNGVSNVLPFGEWVFINPDLTVHLSRYPAGEWLCTEAATRIDPTGFGVATSTLYDERGPVGAGAQSLFVDRL